MERKDTGTRGETLAQSYLKHKGYTIVEANYRCRFGEIDIVAKLKDTLVFIEVRTKQSHNFGTPEESITQNKARKLRNCAYHYCQNHKNIPQNWRVDFIAVELDITGNTSRIEQFENIVEEG